MLQSMGSRRAGHDLATEHHEVIRVDSNPVYWCSYKKRRLGHKTHRKENYVMLSEKKFIYKSRREASEEINPADPLISDFQCSEL